MRKNSITKSDFQFQFSGYGHYKVTYQSPTTLKMWSKTIDDMGIIDLTKNEDSPKKVNLIRLKNIVKY